MDTMKRMRNNTELARRIAAESMVLLKNSNECLPLQSGTNAAVFGVGQFNTVKGGTGSGEVNNLNTVSIMDGLAGCAEINTDPELYELYKEHAGSSKIEKVGLLEYSANHYEEYVPEPGVIEECARRNDVAVVVVTRLAGEGADVDRSEICLTVKERELLEAVCGRFASTILVLNTPGYMEISEYMERLAAVLFVGLPGQEGGNAVADVLTGKVCVSGKLTDTWPLSCDDYPNTEYFGKYYPNGNATFHRAKKFVQTDVPYHDDIYVGYRYFDTFGVDVLFPFGYGLSWGEAAVENSKVTLENGIVTVSCHVQNKSANRPCREVVEVYASAPDGRLEKPYQELKGFKKTGVLEPQRGEKVTVSFAVRDLASYDESTASYILEPGYYYVRAGFSGRDTHIAGAVYVENEIVTSRLENMFDALPADFERLSKKGQTPITYPGEETEKREAEASAAVLASRDVECFTAKYSKPFVSSQGRVGLRLEDVLAGKGSFEELAASMTEEELCRFVCGQGMDFSSFEGFNANASKNDEQSNDVFVLIQTQGGGDAVFVVPGEAGQTRDYTETLGVPPMVLADGPAGLRLTRDVKKNGEIVAHQYCTAFPTGSILACCFDPELMRQFGAAVGEEMAEYQIDLWLAPGLNIHRNPKCGRNYEYFSEDPVVSGICAASITQGVQSQGGGTTIKHLAANNQEFMRGQSNDILSERALREIYLRGFEIAVKTSHPKALMTAYNDVNGIPCADSRELCTYILRDEWGFDGLVMTDWGGGNSHPAMSMWAGNDMIQPGGALSFERLLNALTDGKPVVSNGVRRVEMTITRSMVEECAVRIMRVIADSLAYKRWKK